MRQEIHIIYILIGHEHLGSFGIINMNGRIYDPVSASFFSPDPFVVDATNTQAFNRYSYCLNNPLMYTDPSGEFIFGLLNGIKDLFKNIEKSAISLWTGEKYKWNWHDTKMGWEIDKGWFRGDIKQIISRFTVELPQSLLGYLASGTHSLFGGVKSVTHLDGATVVESYSSGWGAFTLGSFILGQKDIRAEAGNKLFMHEYGHYMQSQEMGWGYLLSIGLPSLFSAAFSSPIAGDKYNSTHSFFYTETDANIRASWYFWKYYGVLNWDDNRYPRRGR